MGALTGGERLTARLGQIAEKTRGRPEVSVGFLRGATYPDGTSVPTVAAVNEFGAPSRGQPPRPFFRNMIADKKGTWGSAVAKILPSVNYDAKAALNQVGMGVKGQLQESINSLTEPKLADSTVRRKGFSKPLIDTSHMLNSVDYEVKAED